MKISQRNLRVSAALAGILITILVCEIVLSYDPLGVIYLREVATLWSNSEEIPAGWAQKPGTYQFRNWATTILPDNTRKVPDAPTSAPRTWVILGDSVAFGYGVDDANTFANVMARALPNIHIINAAVSGYNSENIRRRVQDFPDAERFIYLVINNDAESTAAFRATVRTDLTHTFLDNMWSILYLQTVPHILTTRSQGSFVPTDVTRFESDVRALASDNRVMMVGFESDPLAQAARTWVGAEVIADVGHPVSWADGHPNAEGHQEIAAALLALIER